MLPASFAAFLRLGEVTYNPADVINNTRFLQTKVTRSCIRFSPNYDHLTLYLKRSKTDVDHKGVTILVAAIEGPFCTIAAMRHLFVMDPQPNDAPLFNFNGLPFTKDRLQKALKASLQYASVPTQGLTLHSFRKGAAQHGKDSGIRDEQIQAMGRWTLAASISTLLHHQRCYIHTVSNSKPANHSHSPIPPLFGPRLHMLRLRWPPDCHRLLSSFPA